MKRVLLVAAVALGFAVAAYAATSESNTELYDLLESSSIHKRYVQQNPGEAARVEGYWRTGGAKPTVSTAYGRFLVEVAEDRVPTPPPPPPPPKAACADGLDNDSDGKIDLADPGCASASDTDETDAPPPPPPPAGSANVWVDANGGTCARTATPGGYSDATACPSFAAAYTAAVSGDVVGVTGSVGVQNFAGGYQSSQGRGTKTLTFRGVVTAHVVRQLHFGSPNLTFDGINVDAGGTKTSGAAFENGGEPFVFRNGAIGGVVDEKGALVTGAGVVFDTVRFHDVTLVTDGVHNECLWAAVADGMVIRNSTFTNCRTFDVFTTYPGWWSPLPPAYGGIRLEGNTFNSPVPAGHPSLYVADTGPNGQRTMTNWTVRNNHFATAPTTAPQQGGVYCGNTGAAPSSWQGAC